MPTSLPRSFSYYCYFPLALTMTSTEEGMSHLPQHLGSRFDPSKHLAYKPPTERVTMKDMGLEHINAPSLMGMTSPFSLASLEGVKAIRESLFQPSVIDHHMTYSSLSGPHVQLRGMAPHAARFVYDFWHSPQVLDIVSQAAGEELTPVFDYELGHTNIQVPNGMDRKEYIYSLPVDPFDNSATPIEAPKQGEKPSMVVGYHRDAYPWVCVLMLSDVSGMIGGETEIKKGDGTTLRAIGPEIGSCVMMQGGYIEHCALPCHGARERITMVTSFRPKNRVVGDLSSLKNILPVCNSYELYDQFVRSRLDIVQEAIEVYRKDLIERRALIEESFGKSGGLKQPTTLLPEFEQFVQIVNATVTNAVHQMAPYGSHPENVFTPPLSPEYKAALTA